MITVYLTTEKGYCFIRCIGLSFSCCKYSYSYFLILENHQLLYLSVVTQIYHHTSVPLLKLEPDFFSLMHSSGCAQTWLKQSYLEEIMR